METNSRAYFHTDWSLRSSTKLLYFFLQRDAGRRKTFIRMIYRKKKIMVRLTHNSSYGGKTAEDRRRYFMGICK